MKILDNTKERVSAATGTYPLYTIITDDYSRMYNVADLKQFDTYNYKSYDVNQAKYLRLKELPVIAQNFYNEEELHRLYPELFI